MITKDMVVEASKTTPHIKLAKKVYAKFPPDSKDKRGGTMNVMLTGDTASALGETDYTNVVLDTMKPEDLGKLATLFKIPAPKGSK